MGINHYLSARINVDLDITKSKIYWKIKHESIFTSMLGIITVLV
jgi:hypothetical protein